jgi:hypothetical protein
LASFLIGVDAYVDGLDFFAFKARKTVFAACYDHSIPAVTAAPLGMGTALLSFMPGGMSFEEYFQWEGCSEAEQALRFLLGLAPSGLHGSYLVDPSSIDLAGKKGPSTVMGCELCAGVTATEVLKILLQRGRVYRLLTPNNSMPTLTALSEFGCREATEIRYKNLSYI